MEKVDYSKSIQSVLVICIALIIFGLIYHIPFLNYVCIALGTSALASKFLADKIHWAWMKLAWVLSLIFPPILFGLIFYLFLTPIAWLAKILSRKDNLKLKSDYPTTFVSKEKVFEKADFKKTW